MKRCHFYLSVACLFLVATSLLSFTSLEANEDKEVVVSQEENISGNALSDIYIHGGCFGSEHPASTECYLYGADDGTDFYWTCDAGTATLQGYSWTIFNYNSFGMSSVTVSCQYTDANGVGQQVFKTYYLY